MRLHLYLRGNIWWVRGSDGGVKFRKSTKCERRQLSKARRVRERWERELIDPDHLRANKATVASACARWLKEIKASMNSETFRFYDVKSKHVERLLGNVALSRLTHDRVLSYIEAREAEGSAPHSLHRELTTLRLILKSAQRAREFSRDPRSVVPKYRAQYEPSTEWVTPETIWACIAHLEPIQGAAVAWTIATCADFGVLHSARRSDVNEEDVLVRGKKTSARKRHVPRIAIMAPFLRHALAYGAPGDVLFQAWPNMAKDCRRACRAAGVPEFTAKTLRHSAATWMVKAGVPLDLVARFLGHGSVAMVTKVYGHLAPTDARRLIDERMTQRTVPAVYPNHQSPADSVDTTDIQKSDESTKDEGSS